LGVPVLKAVIQVVAGRNIAVLVEAAVRNTILQPAWYGHLPGLCRAAPQGDVPGRRQPLRDQASLAQLPHKP
jgi:hypothetical protein